MTAIAAICILACEPIEQPGSREATTPGTLVDEVGSKAGRIRLVKVATIHDPVALGPAMPFVTVTSSEDGRFAIAPIYEPGVIGVFDRSGAFVRRLGGLGSGPGEFSQIGPFALHWNNERLMIHDDGLGRVTVFQNSNMDEFQTHPFTATPRQILFLDRNVMLLQTAIQTKELVGHPFHLVDSTFRLVSSFGYPGGVYTGTAAQTFRPVARVGRTEFWAGFANRYAFELWNTAGKVVRTLRPNASWYKDWDGGRLPPHDVMRPKPVVASIRSDSTGLLWVFTQVADKDWRAAEIPNSRRERPARSAINLEPYIDTVIEVIDPATGRTIARARGSQLLVAYNDERYVYSLHENADGLATVTAWRPELVRSHPTK